MLEVAGASTADGAPLQQATDTGSSAQLFRLQPMGDYLIRTFADKYLAVDGTTGANGAAITQNPRQGTDSFRWRFVNNTEGWGQVSSKVNLDRAMRISGRVRPHPARTSCSGTSTRAFDRNRFAFFR